MHAIPFKSSAAARPAPSCSNCGARVLCLPDSVGEAGLEQLERSVLRRVALPPLATLFRRGEPGQKLYAIREGQFKTQCTAAPGTGAAGHTQVLGFHMEGDVLGLEMLASGHYGCDAVALSESVVCELPYRTLAPLLASEPVLQQQFHRLMAGQLERHQDTMSLLGGARARQRLAIFLLDRARQSRLRGASAESFRLHMSREDIAAYLGLTTESISRILSALRRDGVLQIRNRAVALLDLPLLQRLADGLDPAPDGED
jgi:CRP/FNR family transcriptional regulator